MYDIPTSIVMHEQSFPIRCKGDYRMVLDCFVALNDLELTKEERICSALIIFYENMNDLSDLNNFEDVSEAAAQMFQFFNCGNDIDDTGKQLPRLIDWNSDSQLICSAINKVSGQEIRAVPYMHWWTFLGYYMAIGESPLSYIVGIRHKIANQEKLEKYERKFQAENPQYFKMDYRTEDDKEYDELIKQIWNKED